MGVYVLCVCFVSAYQQGTVLALSGCQTLSRDNFNCHRDDHITGC